MQEENQTIKKNLGLAVRIILLALIICFFLPFCTFSCAYSEDIQVNGIQSTFGVEVMGEHLDGYMLCAVLIIVPIALLVVSFLSKQIKFAEILYVVGAIIDVIILFAYRSRALSIAEENLATAKFGLGYYLEFILNIALLAAAGFLFLKSKDNKGSTENAENNQTE